MSWHHLTPGLDNSIKVRGESKALLQVGRVWLLQSTHSPARHSAFTDTRQNIRHTPMVIFYNLTNEGLGLWIIIIEEDWSEGAVKWMLSCGGASQSYICGMAGSTWLSSLTSPLRKGSDELALNAKNCYYPQIILQFLPTDRLFLLKVRLLEILLEYYDSNHKLIKWWQINLAEMILLFIKNYFSNNQMCLLM